MHVHNWNACCASEALNRATEYYIAFFSVTMAVSSSALVLCFWFLPFLQLVPVHSAIRKHIGPFCEF
jgi:hypothetical protein